MSTRIRGRAHSARRTLATVFAGLAMLLGLVTVQGVNAPTAHANGGYPYHAAADCSGTYGQYSWCVSGWWISGYSYGYRNCTDYSAWRLASLGVPASKYKYLGHAKDWAANAASRGIVVNGTPAQKSVAVKTSGTYGHVAFVDAVHSNGTITVSEYNQTLNGTYGTRTGTPSQLGFSQFIHFEAYMPGQPDVPPSQGGGVGGAQYLGVNQLNAGSQLASGKYIMASNGLHVLVMQGDGNLVLYGSGYVEKWSSGTHVAGSRLQIQGDGNMVIYSPSNVVQWASNTSGVSRLSLQGDGNLVAYSSTNVVKWATNTGVGNSNPQYFGSNELNTGQQLTGGKYLRSSDGTRHLYMQPDGNLVLYGPAYNILWTSATAYTGAYLQMQGDGNIVIYQSPGVSMWAAGLTTATKLIVQNDGNVVARDSAGNAIWATNTGGMI